MKHQRYPTDITDAQWAVLEPEIPAPRPGGRPRKTDMREVLNGIFYITHEGCTWRALPHDFPPWRTVYNYFDAWKRDGTWDRIIDPLRVRLRKAAGRETSPRVACIDSQSAKTAYGGQDVGTDGGKRVRGRKRHIVVDTPGLLPAVVVTAADVDDAAAAQELFAKMPSAKSYRLEEVQADNKYHNHDRYRWLRVHHRDYRIVVVSREPGERRFVPLRSRWVAERTIAWLLRYRRLSREYEHTPESSEAVVKIAAIHHYLRRLHPVAVPDSQRFRFEGHRPKRAA